MERTSKLQIPVEPGTLKALKLLAAGRDSSISELVRIAIEEQYGDSLRDIERRFASTLSAKKNKGAL
jgi:hypothetical protein